MKHFLIATSALALAAAAGAASAADLPRREAPPAPEFRMPAPPPAATWSGFYLGGAVGYGMGAKSNVDLNLSQTDVIPGCGGEITDDSFVTSTESLRLGNIQPGGVFAGPFFGYNHQIGNFVIGVEGDANWSGMRKTSRFSNVEVDQWTHPDLGGMNREITFTDTVELSVGPKQFGSLRGRLGLAFGDVMVYGTGGIGMVNLETRGSLTTSAVGQNLGEPIDQSLSVRFGGKDSWKTSLVGGAGIEYRLSPSLRLRAEYQYHHLDKVNVGGIIADDTASVATAARVNPSFQTIRIGVAMPF